MKQLITVLVIAAFVVGCSDSQADKMKDFIPGVYIKTIDNEFTKGMDTLVIDVLDKTAGSYSIRKKSSYQQVIDGRQLSPQYKVENWTALYDKEINQLMEQRKGKVLSFLPEENKLSLGGSEYKKIK